MPVATRRGPVERRDGARRSGAVRGRLGVAAVLLALAGPASAQDSSKDSAQDLAALRARALDLVNQDRQAHGLDPLTLGPALDEAAQAHARDMLKRHYFAHESPEGDSVQDRYIEAGGSRWRLVEENIARCEACKPPATMETVARLEQGWMNSPHHRENILREGLDRFGYGIVVDDERGLYAVQTFAGPGTPRDLEPDATAAPLSADEQLSRAVRLVNRARRRTGAPPLQSSPALASAARAMLPDRSAKDIDLKAAGDIFQALPPDQRSHWRSISALSGACGGCGTAPTAADIRSFREQWLDNPAYRKVLLDPQFTSLGFALQANGEGRKVAVALLGDAR